jgi:hypothetical protein
MLLPLRRPFRSATATALLAALPLQGCAANATPASVAPAGSVRAELRPPRTLRFVQADSLAPVVVQDVASVTGEVLEATDDSVGVRVERATRAGGAGVRGVTGTTVRLGRRDGIAIQARGNESSGDRALNGVAIGVLVAGLAFFAALLVLPSILPSTATAAR